MRTLKKPWESQEVCCGSRQGSPGLEGNSYLLHPLLVVLYSRVFTYTVTTTLSIG